MDLSSEDFARAFGDALKSFLDARDITYTSAADQLGVERETLYTYWTDDKDGRRRKPRVELLFLACVELGFEFEYKGFRIGAEAVKTRKPSKKPKKNEEQLRLEYAREFNLTDDDGKVAVRMKRQLGRIELSMSLKAAS